MPLYIAFMGLTEAFDLVSGSRLFVMQKIDCLPQLLSITASFHDNVKGTVSYDGASSEPLASRS